MGSRGGHAAVGAKEKLREHPEGLGPGRCSGVPVPSGGHEGPSFLRVGPIPPELLRLMELGDDAETSLSLRGLLAGHRFGEFPQAWSPALRIENPTSTQTSREAQTPQILE